MRSFFSSPPPGDHLAHLRYRPDIDGLRALAVLLVVGFHIFPTLLPGGFIGVDIFFVISGFLISGIIFGSLEKEKFSYLEFYSRRVRRIFPTLILVLAFGYIVGWFTLFPEEFIRLGSHLAAGAAFLMNFLLFKQVGYFDTNAATKPFLHLWSLGVEEQFYLIWPVLLSFAWKRKWNFLKTTISIAFISFIINVYYVYHKQEVAFYLPFSRFWELMIGAILAYIKIHRPSLLDKKHHLQSTIGLILIVIGFFFIRNVDKFPGWWALLPTLGAFFLISAGPQGCWNRYLLGRPLAVKIGLISYPLYLWHWVLLSYSIILVGHELSIELKLILIVVSLFSAWLSFRWIEKPFRHYGFEKTKVTILLVFMIILCGVGFATHLAKKNAFRKFSPMIMSLLTSSQGPQEDCMDIPLDSKKPWFCHFGNTSYKTAAFVYGDSHAYYLLPAFKAVAERKQIDILLTANAGCPPLLDVYVLGDGKAKECHAFNQRIFDYIARNKPPVVFLVSRWNFYTDPNYESNNAPISRVLSLSPSSTDMSQASSRQAFIIGLDHTLAAYQKLGIKVYLIEDNPTQLIAPSSIFRRLIFHPELTNPKAFKELINKKSVTLKAHEEMEAFVHHLFVTREFLPNVYRLNFDSIYCNQFNCPIVINTTSMYEDSNHMSVSGALRVAQRLEAETVLH